MRRWSKTARALPLVALAFAACVPPAKPPPRVAAPAPPLPRLAPPPPPVSADWRDWPLTLGEWTYAQGGASTESRYGPAGAPELVVRCDQASRRVQLLRTGAAQGVATMAVTTSAGNIAWTAQPVAGGWAASLAAADPFLDKMAFSRGRFIVAVTGTARLVVPSWPEFARVVEDCRG